MATSPSSLQGKGRAGIVRCRLEFCNWSGVSSAQSSNAPASGSSVRFGRVVPWLSLVRSVGSLRMPPFGRTIRLSAMRFRSRGPIPPGRHSCGAGKIRVPQVDPPFGILNRRASPTFQTESQGIGGRGGDKCRDGGFQTLAVVRLSPQVASAMSAQVSATAAGSAASAGAARDVVNSKMRWRMDQSLACRTTRGVATEDDKFTWKGKNR